MDLGIVLKSLLSLLRGKAKTYRDFFLSDYLLATELGVLKLSKRFGSTYLGPKAVSTDELQEALVRSV